VGYLLLQELPCVEEIEGGKAMTDREKLCKAEAAKD
jgi:hypothetical protein